MNNTDNTSSKPPFKFPTSGFTGQNPEKDFDSESIQMPSASQRRVILHHRYHSDDLTSILFLSKRGMSRSPLAREIMRERDQRILLFWPDTHICSRGYESL